jgi:Lar family restriction alleviation protein
MPTEIKPCPFCGKPAKVFENRAGGIVICCNSLDCEMLSADGESETQHESDDLIAAWNRRASAGLEQQLKDELAANERDRSNLALIVHNLDEEIRGRMWLTEGRGSYEWDDDRYRQEFEWAVEAILAKIEPLRKIVADLKNCPTTQAEVDAARSSGAAQ